MERHLLSRCVFPRKEVKEHEKKRMKITWVRGKTLGVDGYNVLITAESILSDKEVVMCDDGFIRDLRGIFGKYRISGLTDRALREILNLIRRSGAKKVHILFDKQVSRSGELASVTRNLMRKMGIPGDAAAVGGVDFLLRKYQVAATSDSVVIKRAKAVWDIPAELKPQKVFNLTKIR